MRCSVHPIDICDLLRPSDVYSIYDPVGNIAASMKYVCHTYHVSEDDSSIRLTGYRPYYAGQPNRLRARARATGDVRTDAGARLPHQLLTPFRARALL